MQSPLPESPVSIAELSRDALLAMDWLIEPIGNATPVTFVPNPGNIGDALINLACWRHLQRRFPDAQLVSVDEVPETDVVLVGGGGNLVERYYHRVADLLSRVPIHCRIFIYPTTIAGFDQLLQEKRSQLRVLCRERISHAHALKYLPPESVGLGHDASFTLAPWLVELFGSRLERRSGVAAKIYRRDVERAVQLSGGVDVMAHYGCEWTDLALAEEKVRVAATFMLGFAAIDTDRLHGAILAAMLNRETVLRPNSYFKNEAVYAHSLSALPNVRFNQNFIA